MKHADGEKVYARGDITVVRAVLPHPEDDSRILVMQRSMDSHKDGGYWQLPGGKEDPEDKNLFDGVIREFREETGFSIRLTEGLSLIDRYTIEDNSERHGQLYIAYAGVARYVSGSLVRSSEHMDDAWIRPSELDQTGMAFTPQTYRAIQLYNNLVLGLEDYIPGNTAA